jgi:pyroglutamyl-peptidase
MDGSGTCKIRVLATGFGPFPGVPDNASARLIGALAKAAPPAGIDLRLALLPVSWQACEPARQEAVRQHRPGIILHFGVSRRASGFEIESRAVNWRDGRAGADGTTCAPGLVETGALADMKATLPADALASALRNAGFAACASRDAGRYLCNTTFFHALRDAEKAMPSPLVGFVHLPALGVAGAAETDLTEASLLEGALILSRASARYVLAERTKTISSSEVTCGGAIF